MTHDLNFQNTDWDSFETKNLNLETQRAQIEVWKCIRLSYDI